MPDAGAVQVTVVALSCLQVEGGSWPLTSALLFARTSAAISAFGVGFGFGFGFGDVAVVALWCDPKPLSPAQVPRPASTRATAASTAIQCGRRYQRGPRGPAAGGG